ncbi:peptidylprolyl isomerase [Candidatus Kaiserbacteria bacterium CG10_big_fil_rev_8_21_14_0_10_45_20]|uniref:Peptidyl-prolyl cis-trans isomerase n=1 Tax=Candidatus Kaiserbacteria bacterium CG10_big_fil_rev_8_21_14_0_10_45_20 TaxID=1974607 RepID=A0A2H0UEY3_9BACT|nr:MAG: peptidylprolyl isomerase [Candidatus Kaiserbacteria bacterium CG10_big_fil_rev_8_21_14_0_10_45_20]
MQKKHVAIAVFLALLVIALFLMLGLFNVSEENSENGGAVTGPQAILDELAKNGAVSSLMVYDTVVGDGAEVQQGDLIAVHYTGVLPDGTVFDSSIPRGTPIEFTIGAGQVIQGWEQGFAGMKVGGKRLIAVPPELGYGANAVGSIPPNSTLIFDVELIEIIQSDSETEAQ